MAQGDAERATVRYRGKVNTLSGAPVDGMEVEIFINETKEQGAGGWELQRRKTAGSR